MRLLVSGGTRSVRGLASRWHHRLGHLLTPANGNSVEAMLSTRLPWAADNGAFSGFDEQRFLRFLDKIRNVPGCLFVATPDVVADARATLASFPWWRPIIAATGQPIALVGQDGIEELTIPWDDFDAWFIGGSDDWKLSKASVDLASEARQRNKWIHMGRVNSLRRIEIAWDMGCDSVDGTSMSMFGDTYIDRFCKWIDHLQGQGELFTEVEE